ncbi:MAG: AraC family transcriptional regulator, partial [Clostridia bacterium]|nr:AraC family transcriptional regulator [Clostridia bacterium]
LEKAKELLEGSDMSVAEIAAECGFYDSSHLVKCMKQRKNLLPTEIRKRK